MADTEFFTSKECAQYRRCSDRTLDRERQLGIGPTHVKDGRRVLYRKSDVDLYLAAHRRVGELRDQK
jgi:hypothetical protein